MRVHVHPDNKIILDVGDGRRYRAARADFDRHAGTLGVQPPANLPATFVEYVFEDRGRHYVSDGKNQRAVPPGFTKARATAILARLDGLLAEQAKEGGGG